MNINMNINWKSHIIIFICSLLSLYYIITYALNPIIGETKILYEPVENQYLAQAQKDKQDLYLAKQEQYFRGRDIERLEPGAYKDMKFLDIKAIKKRKYKPDPSALPPKIKFPDAEKDYAGTWIHKKNHPVYKEGMAGHGKPLVDQGVLTTAQQENQLKTVSPGGDALSSDIMKKVKICRAINGGGANCDDLEGTECGYCLDTDEAYYGDKKGPKIDVCQTKSWIAPGPNVVYYCKRAKERRICRGMEDCGDVAGQKEICGWCPMTEQGLVKKANTNTTEGGWIVKYPEVDDCTWKQKKKQAKWLGWGGQATPTTS